MVRMKAVMGIVTALVVVGAAFVFACSSTDEEGQAQVTPIPTSVDNPQPVSLAPVPYFGEESIEERIVNADTIVIARLDRTTSEVVRGSGKGWSDNYYVALTLHLTVNAYLKGNGANSITAFTIQGANHKTQEEAEDAKPGIVASRVTLWDNREAIIFLTKDDPDSAFSDEVQADDDYFLTIGGQFQDAYNLHSRHSKLWLPSAEAAGTGDNQEFLLAVPKAGVTTPTITRGELKSRIAAINAELNAGDGSDGYRQCISNKYHLIRTEDYRMSAAGPGARHSFEPIWDGTFASGRPAGDEVYEYFPGWAQPADKSGRVWLDGPDSSLFIVRRGDLRTGSDYDRDGHPDGYEFDQSVVSVRPIPIGNYDFNHHVIPWRYLACGHTSTFEMTANVTAPEGTLHELFFDPVAVGTAVGADATNGVLKPAAFNDANGTSATIERIAWEPGTGESGTVKLEIDPLNGVAGHILDFIELDGSVSLSLDGGEATVDEGVGAYSWSVESQPWEEGDLLVVRVREG